MIPKGFLSSLVALESFNIILCERLKGTIELSPSLKHLREVRIIFCPNLERFDVCSSSSTEQQLALFPCCHTLEMYDCNAISSVDVRSFASLRELKITDCKGLHALQGLPFLTALEKLSIGGIGGFSPELLYIPPLISEDDGDEVASNTPLLPSLRHLHINKWPALQAPHLQHLTMLKSLSISFFTNLTKLPKWIGNLASLEELKIWQCENLTHLPSKEQIQGLTFLRKLDIGFCPNFQSIKQPVLPWCHTCLQELQIWSCDGVTSIDLGSFVSLRKLKVTKCRGLQALQGLPFLTALEELKLGPFSEDLDFFPLLLGGNYDNDNGDEVASNTPLLLPSLRKVVINGWPALQALPHHLQHLTMLKSLKIRKFTNLTELPEWIGNLASLEELKIMSCDKLTHLPSKEQMQRLTFLKHLRIFDCPSLEERCMGDGPEWPKISHIPYLDI
ncbi:hypothetical protein Syun_005943 [Stephania yunnanensis]|uniref:R13L1/DRL21-like LRR repeat region domain-containing protein n=1 Tax=Stephania yunnanensis TaxID=152371 RepID=A0AAP0KXE2_9MAGN